MKNVFRRLVGTIVLLTAFGQAEIYAETKEPLYLFISEMETFTEKANELKNGDPYISDDEMKTKVDELTIIAGRVAKVYFAQIESEIKPDLDKYLHERITQNEEIRHFFLLLGNQFLAIARSALDERQQQEKRYRMYSTVGGSILGLASGGAVLYFAKGVAKQAMTATLVVVGLTAAGGVGGYFAGPAVTGFMLPADPSIKSADDFLKKYPAGEDFIYELEDFSPDLRIGLSEVDEAMYALR